VLLGGEVSRLIVKDCLSDREWLKCDESGHEEKDCNMYVCPDCGDIDRDCNYE
jgi:hypothetical protein